MKIHRTFSYFILFLASCLVTLFCVELVYRGYVHFQKPLHRPSSFPHIGWELTPGAKTVEENSEGIPVEYLINSAGFRDKTSGSWNRWKPTDIKIAFIGDSVTYGSGVEYDNTYPNKVESIFNKAGFHVRIANIGIDGTNTLQHLAIKKEFLISI